MFSFIYESDVHHLQPAKSKEKQGKPVVMTSATVTRRPGAEKLDSRHTSSKKAHLWKGLYNWDKGNGGSKGHTKEVVSTRMSPSAKKAGLSGIEICAAFVGAERGRE